MIKNNIILIGMPGAGKSTIGVILAKRLGFDFMDTDLAIQAREKARLQQIIDTKGLAYFRHVEEQVLLNLELEHNVIATGGSVVYYRQGLTTFSRTGHLVYLQVPLEILRRRIADMGRRGLVMADGQTFDQLYHERIPLYEEFSELTVHCAALNAEQVAVELEREIKLRWPALLHAG